MRHFSDTEKPSDRIELTGFGAEFHDALEEENNKIKKRGQSSTLLFGGDKSKAMAQISGIALMLSMSRLFQQIRPVSWWSVRINSTARGAHAYLSGTCKVIHPHQANRLLASVRKHRGTLPTFGDQPDD